MTPPPSAPPAPDPEAELEDTVIMAHVERVMADARQRPPGTAPPADPVRDSGLLARPVVPLPAKPPRSAEADPGGEHRLLSRRPVRRRVGAAVRKGTMGLGRDVGIDLLDATEDGLRVRLRVPVETGAEVSVELSRPGVSRPLALVAEVRWCRPAPDGTAVAGLRLRRRLSYLELTNLTG